MQEAERGQILQGQQGKISWGLILRDIFVGKRHQYLV